MCNLVNFYIYATYVLITTIKIVNKTLSFEISLSHPLPPNMFSEPYEWAQAVCTVFGLDLFSVMHVKFIHIVCIKSSHLIWSSKLICLSINPLNGYVTTGLTIRLLMHIFV